jgi:hypothetical protein
MMICNVECLTDCNELLFGVHQAAPELAADSARPPHSYPLAPYWDLVLLVFGSPPAKPRVFSIATSNPPLAPPS